MGAATYVMKQKGKIVSEPERGHVAVFPVKGQPTGYNPTLLNDLAKEYPDCQFTWFGTAMPVPKDDAPDKDASDKGKDKDKDKDKGKDE
jgi:hypothetical protein